MLILLSQLRKRIDNEGDTQVNVGGLMRLMQSLSVFLIGSLVVPVVVVPVVVFLVDFVAAVFEAILDGFMKLLLVIFLKISLVVTGKFC